MTRADGRAPDEMRPISMELDFITSVGRDLDGEAHGLRGLA